MTRPPSDVQARSLARGSGRSWTSGTASSDPPRTFGQPDADYLAAVRARFERWVIDLCTRDFDAQWLAYQEEIGLRHHTSKKNQTDKVDSPVPHVPMSHIFALVVPVTLSVRQFLAEGGADDAEIEAMHQAWFKAVTVTLVLWTRPYAGDLW